MEDEDASIVHHWERRVLVGLAAGLISVFGIWATVVWNGTQAVVNEVRMMRQEVMADRVEQEKYRAAMERRIAILEVRQAYVLRSLERMDGGRPTP